MPSRSVTPPGGAGRPVGQPEVATAVRLVQRRQGWLWTGLASLAGAAAYGIISVSYIADYAAATVAAASPAIVLVLLAVAATGLAFAAADTVRLRRAGPGIRAAAAAAPGRFPLAAHPYYRKPAHRASWCCGWLVLLALAAPAVLDMPCQLAAAAYLAGIGRQDFPGPAGGCAAAGCTAGGPGGFRWADPVPLGRSFPVRALVTVTGPDPALVPGFGAAVSVLDLGLVFDGFAVLTAVAVVSRGRYLRRARRPTAAGPSAAAP
jgi:hypothetical protein